MPALAKNLKTIRETIDHAARKSGRKGAEVTLLAVTKFQSVDLILALEALQVKAVAESRVQELADKYDAIKGRFGIHFIGHLQTNKAKKAAEMADVIHSVDSARLAGALDGACAGLKKKLPIMIEVNTSGESQKHGVPPENLMTFLREASLFTHLDITGLMTMAMVTQDKEKARGCFRRLRELRDEARKNGFPSLQHLSMGMSQDYEVAVEEGATLVRIGTALFNTREA